MRITKPRTIVASIATLAAIGLAGTLSSHAELLLYEGFNYTTGTTSGSGVLLGGQNGGTGFAAGSSWTTVNTGTNAGTTPPGPGSVTVYPQGSLSGVDGTSTGAANVFNGTVANTHSSGTSNFTTSGGYFGPVGDPLTVGNTTDHTYAYRAIDPTVTATFTAGTSTWFSFVSSVAYNANPGPSRFAIGTAQLTTTDRGMTAQGEAIGAGGSIGTPTGFPNLANRVYPQFWDQAVAGTGSYQQYDAGGLQTATTTSAHYVADSFSRETTNPDATVGVANIVIFRIDWSDTGPDVISAARFLQTDGTLTEAMFNSAAKSSAAWAVQPNLDQSQFGTISLAGSRYFADEIRIGTTFNDVIGVVPTITAVGSPLAAMSTTHGTPSAATPFTVSGTMMTAGILVTAPAGFEVSLTESSGYASTTTVGAAGTIASTTVYVRLAATAPVAGDYNARHIVLTSPGAAPVNITTAASGNTVSPEFPAEITALESPLAAVSSTYGTPSTETTFTVSGSNMLAGILVTAPAGFEVSLTSGSGFADTTTVGAAGTITSTTVYVRLAASAPVAGTYDARNIVLSSSTATSVNVTTAASGNTVSPKPLTVTATGPTKIYGTTLVAGMSSTNFTADATEVGSQVVTSVTLTPDAAGASPTTTTGAAYVITPSLATGTGGFLASNYDITYTPYEGMVMIATPILSVTNPLVNYDGASHAAVVSASVDGIVSNVKYDGSDTVPAALGTYVITADFAPTDTTNYLSLTDAPAGNFAIVQRELMMVNVQFYATTSSAPSMQNQQGPVASYDTTPYWNQFKAANWTFIPAGPYTLVQADNTASGLKLSLAGTTRATSWNGQGADGIKVFGGGAFFDNYNGQNSLTAVISGLTVGAKYDLYAMSAADSWSDTRFTVNGDTAGAIRLRGNASAALTPDGTTDYTQWVYATTDAAGDDPLVGSSANTAYFKHLTPDVDGKLTLVMTYANTHRLWTDDNTRPVGLSGFQLVQVPSGTSSDYDAWAGPGGYNLSGDPADDDDGDNLSNFMEYAFGLNPTSGSSVNPITRQLDKTTGIFKYTRRATPVTTGVNYIYEWSTTLSNPWDVFTPDATSSDLATPVEEITVDVPDSLLGNSKLFLRVRAE